MQLLFIDRDRQAARTLHSEFLGCRGFQWDLVHCDHALEAANQLEANQFQVVLYHGHDAFEETRCDISRLLQQPICPPIVTLLDDATCEAHLRLIDQGAHFSLARRSSTGVDVMRQLRMAEQRDVTWQRLTKKLDPNFVHEHVQLSLPQEGESLPAESMVASPLDVITRLPQVVRVAVVTMNRSSYDARGAGGKLEYHPFPDIRELLECLSQGTAKWHAMVIEQSALEELRPDQWRDLSPYLAVIPSLVVTWEKSDYATLAYLDRGYVDCLIADNLSSQLLEESILKAVVRHRRQLIDSFSVAEVGKHVSDRRRSVRPGANRRRHVRFLLERPLLAIPLLPSGAPDRDHMCEAMSVDVSLGGIGLTVPTSEQLPNRNWVIGVRDAHNQYDYVSAYLRRASYQSDGIQIGLVFQHGEEDFFAERNLVPELQSNTKRFGAQLSTEVLDQWADIGVLTRDLVSRLRVCPECEGVSAYGRGCSECGSPRYELQELIHHFACAHVDFAASFDLESGCTCPKCLQSDLVVGADFEIIKSRYVCPDCGHHGSQLAEVGSCLNCHLRFPTSLALEKDVYGYHVRRLDILALVDAAR